MITDFPQGWATIAAAVIAIVGGPLGGFVLHRQTKKLRQIRSDVATTLFHVANEHVGPDGKPSNMRDDQDAKHAETMTAIRGLGSRLKNVENDVGGIRHDIRTLYSADGEQVRQANRDREQAAKDRDRINDLEKTIPRDELGRFTKKEENR